MKCVINFCISIYFISYTANISHFQLAYYVTVLIKLIKQTHPIKHSFYILPVTIVRYERTKSKMFRTDENLH